MQGEGRRLTEQWTRAVLSLAGAGLRMAYLRSEIEHRPLDDAAYALDEIASAAEQADERAREVLFALSPLLSEEGMAAWVVALRVRAREKALLALGRLLRAGQPGALHYLPEPPVDERRLATSREGKPLSLGERKALARRPSRSAMEKLLLDPHPMVIRNLLDNPRLTEDDVLRLAARRPGRSVVLGEIARHPKWSLRARVRLSLVLNPYTPAQAAVPFVRLLLRSELMEVLASTKAPAVVRAAAREMLERRPPVPEGGEGELQ